MRNVKVTVYDKQVYPTHFEEAEHVHQGSVTLKNNHIYVTYKETETGITNLIKTSDEGIVVKRIGALGGQLRFEKGKVHTTQYATPYGIMPLEIQTTKCDIYMLEKGIKLYIEYMLFMEKEKVSDHTLMIITN